MHIAMKISNLKPVLAEMEQIMRYAWTRAAKDRLEDQRVKYNERMAINERRREKTARTRRMKLIEKYREPPEPVARTREEWLEQFSRTVVR